MLQRNQTLTERILGCIFRFVSENRLSFAAGIISGLAAHLFTFTNKLVNGDDIVSLFERGASIDSGRWGIEITWRIFPQVSMPWLHGLISIVFFSLAVCLVLRLFRIENRLLKALLPAVFLSFPAMTAMYCYMFTSSAYGLAFLLAVLSVCIYTGAVSVSEKYRFALSCAALIMSLGIYQAYVAAAASYFVILMIQKLLRGDESAKDVFMFGVRGLLMLAVSLVVYFAITLITVHLSGGELLGYAVDGDRGILFKAALAYNGFIRTFTNGYFGYVNSGLSAAVHLLSVLFCAVVVLQWLAGTKDKAKAALLLLCVFLLPLSIYCMYLIADVGIIHSLVMFAFSSVYVFSAVLFEHALAEKGKLSALSREVIAAALLLVAVNNVYFSNKVYFSMHLKYENAYAYYTGLVTQLRMNEDYDEGLKVAIVGKEDNYYKADELALGEFSGPSNIINVYTRDWFIERYVGFDADFASEREKGLLMYDERVIEMPEYPYNGSIKRIDDYMVVKLD